MGNNSQGLNENNIFKYLHLWTTILSIQCILRNCTSMKILFYGSTHKWNPGKGIHQKLPKPQYIFNVHVNRKTKDLAVLGRLFVDTFEYGETGELGVALTQGQVCPVICLLLSLLIFLFIQQNGYHLQCSRTISFERYPNFTSFKSIWQRSQ